MIPIAIASASRQVQLDLLNGRKCTSYPPARVLVDCLHQTLLCIPYSTFILQSRGIRERALASIFLKFTRELYSVRTQRQLIYVDRLT